MTEEDKDKLIKLAILGYYDEKIKSWVLSQLESSGIMTPEEITNLQNDVTNLQNDVTNLINDSKLEII